MRVGGKPALSDTDIADRRAMLADLLKREIVFNGEEIVFAAMTYKFTAEVVPPGEWRGTAVCVAGMNRRRDPIHKRAASENAALVAVVREFARTRKNVLNKHTIGSKTKQQVLPPAAVERAV